MHMADALISPTVGGAMWAAAAGLTALSARKLKDNLESRSVPLMGVMGAFIFAAQMINFSIPGTGSSGHLGGGMLLSILLGPYAAFLVMASILLVQALFFADGGLLALGCNIFNLGFFPCFVAYPLIYRTIVNGRITQRRILLAAMIASIAGLEMGAFGVVVETTLSGISDIPFAAFSGVMLSIHLAIGIVEGCVTGAVVLFLWNARPEVFAQCSPSPSKKSMSMKGVLAILVLVSLMLGGLISWFASSHPDGLEWSVAKITGKEELAAPDDGIHSTAEDVRTTTALLPDYGFKTPAPDRSGNLGTTVSGIVGSALTLLLVAAIAVGIRAWKSRKP